MSEGTKIKHTSDLLQTRNQVREELETGMLRPHGKLWNMDVFSWYKPNKHELENTISAFPFPTIWFGTRAEIEAVLEADEEWMHHISLICLYDHGSLSLPNDVLHRIPTVLACKDLADGLELLKKLKQAKSVLLFTASGEQWKTFKNTFETYLSIHQ